MHETELTDGLRTALLQVGGDGEETHDQRVERVAELVERVDADLVVLPELWASGFFAFDAYAREAEPLDGPTVARLGAAARNADAWLVGGSLLERAADGRLHNTMVVLSPGGELVAAYRKMHVFGFQSREAELLSAGSELVTVELPWTTIGLSTCYDLRFPELYRILSARGAELLICAAAWPAARRAHWELLTSARALENQAFLLACGGAGVDHGVALSGRSAVIDPWGRMLAGASDNQPTVVSGALDLEGLRAYRREFPQIADRRIEILDGQAIDA